MRNTLLYRLYEVPRIGNFTETACIIEDTRGWEEGDGKLSFNGYRISVWDDAVLEMDITSTTI